jgi:hypothetical protein
MKWKQMTKLLLLACCLGGFAPVVQAFYNPDTGRWLSRDPIEERGGKNIYEFVANSPIGFYDKLGLQMGFSGFGEIDWRHSQPWDLAAIANSLCPFKEIKALGGCTAGK